jgi:hypothetical protein
METIPNGDSLTNNLGVHFTPLTSPTAPRRIVYGNFISYGSLTHSRMILSCSNGFGNLWTHQNYIQLNPSFCIKLIILRAHVVAKT